jgi:hypothetical protein
MSLNRLSKIGASPGRSDINSPLDFSPNDPPQNVRCGFTFFQFEARSESDRTRLGALKSVFSGMRNVSVRCGLPAGKLGPGCRLPAPRKSRRRPVLGSGPRLASTAGPTGPAQAIGRAARNAPCPSSAMSSGRLFLGGLLASRARFRLTDTARIKRLPLPAKGPIIERQTVS